jgi:SNF2 family DNA or RNA helicase
MLCDEMGLGKTVETIALMLANPPKVPKMKPVPRPDELIFKVLSLSLFFSL